MYIKLSPPAAARASTYEPRSMASQSWRAIPQKIRLRAQVSRAARRLYRKLRVWLGLDWPLGIELAAEALHQKFYDAVRAPKGGAR